jgi:hypothetical protein
VCGLLSTVEAEYIVMFLEVVTEYSGNSFGEIEGGLAMEVCACITLDADKTTEYWRSVGTAHFSF